MTLNASKVNNNSKPQQPIEPGSYPARLVQVIDLGLQPQEYQGETKDPQNEIMTTYELTDEFMKDEDGNDIEDKPRWVSETFALHSLNSDRAKSTKRYYALDPDARYNGDWSQLVETPATVVLINKAGKGKNAGKVFTNITEVSAMRPKDASRLPALKNEPKVFSMEEPDVELFLSFPEFIQNKIKAGLEFKGSKLDDLLQNHKGGEKKEAPKKAEPKGEVDDSIPFDDDALMDNDDGNW